jgi:hypothetical protein
MRLLNSSSWANLTRSPSLNQPRTLDRGPIDQHTVHGPRPTSLRVGDHRSRCRARFFPPRPVSDGHHRHGWPGQERDLSTARSPHPLRVSSRILVTLTTLAPVANNDEILGCLLGRREHYASGRVCFLGHREPTTSPGTDVGGWSAGSCEHATSLDVGAR